MPTKLAAMHEKYLFLKPGSNYDPNNLTDTQLEEVLRRRRADEIPCRTIEESDVYLTDVRHRKHLSWY